MSNQEIFDFVKEGGCCTICCLRFLKARGNEYENLSETLKKLRIKADEDNAASGPTPKKSKSNTCVACLGLFSEQFLDEIITSVSQHPEFAKFECDAFVVALSFPILLNIRQLSLWFALIDKFNNDDVISSVKPPDVPLKEASKLVLNPKLSLKLNKTYNNQNGIMINIFIGHKDEEADLAKLKEIDELLFRTNPRKQYKNKEKGITRGYFERTFSPTNVKAEVYKEKIPVPPAVPNSPLFIEKITLAGPTVFVAGRYQKFSRKLSHSPWVLQGKRIMEDSIQELIIKAVAPYFDVPENKIIFSSSGREDVDVRCIGKGRPFVLEIPDSKRTKLPREIAESMELAIEDASKISVSNLQMVEREELVHLKTGEEKKKKLYRALCILKEPATVEVLQKLNIPDGFQTEQWTPIRVLHRRPLHKRPRMIYSVRAFVDKTNAKMIILDIVTQAGTYIKELVHGEFGRTAPSISSIIDRWIDIIALDVTGIDLDWPKDIDNRITVKKENDKEICDNVQ